MKKTVFLLIVWATLLGLMLSACGLWALVILISAKMI